LGLVATTCGGQVVLLDGFGAVVEEVEHLSGVELGAAADPVAAGGLGGGEDVVLCGCGNLVLAALGVGETEVGHVEARLDEVAGLLCVREDGVVLGDGAGAVAGVFGEVGDLEAEEIVVGILVGESLLDDESFGIARVVAEKERESRAGLDGGDDAVGCGFAEELEAFLLVAVDAGDADHHADEAGKAGDGELLDAKGHLRVGVVGIDLEGGFAVVAGGVSLAGGGDVAVVDERDEGGVHAAGVATGEVGVGVVGVGFDLLVGEGYGLVGEGLDAIADGLGDGHVAFGGEEGVVGVVGGVEEVLTIEFAEDDGEDDVADGDDALWVGALDGFEA
jgi:hypothetical protein